MTTERGCDCCRERIDFNEADKKSVLRGAKQATCFIKKVVAGEKVDGEKYSYGERFILELSRRIVQMPRMANTTELAHALLRSDDTKKLGYIDLAHSYELPTKLYLYGHWFQDVMAQVAQNPEDLVGVLEAASAAHYGFVMHSFHPLENGNGRAARGIMNTVLMSQSYELTAHGWAIPPIPIVRAEGTSPKYIAALRSIDSSRLLNNFMVFIAQRWEESNLETLGSIYQRVGTPKDEADRKLVAKLEGRIELLRSFVRQGIPEDVKGRGRHYREFPVPASLDRISNL